jgi:hypothetical protein
MAKLVTNQSPNSFFNPPELTAAGKIHATMHRPLCGNRLDSGSFYSTATIPAHGSRITDSFEQPVYSVFRKSGTEFSSSMVGSVIRLSKLSLSSLSYTDPDGKPQIFDGTTNTDFVAKVKEVLTSDVLKLDRPLVVSNVSLKTGIKDEDSPYFENIERYTVTNVSNGTFEIVHSARIETANLISSPKLCSIIILSFNNLSFTSQPSTYRIFKKSYNTSETPTCIAFGNVEPNELLMTSDSNYDFQNGGKFFSAVHSQTYWLASSGLTFTHTPSILIDSITLNTSGISNESEASYLIFKENSGEVGRSSTYIQTTYQTGSAWYTNSQLFTNFAVDPSTYYSCSVNNPLLVPYTSSIEVVNNGGSLNSNSIKVLKNTTYEFSVDWTNCKPSTSEYQLIAYFITTSTKGTTEKFLLGILDNTTATTYSGTYNNKFKATRTMFGTIVIVPKNINTIAIANVSLKPYMDNEYALDSFTVEIPYTPLLQNEKIELVGEIYDSLSYPCCLPMKTYLHTDPSGFTEQIVGTVVGDVLIDGGTP